ncbi:hypothetical protein ABZ907_15605 [Nonomuraea wenchangensis]
MSSLLKELAWREAAARRRIEEIREQITALTSQMQDEQDRLSRLTITRGTVEEILGEAAQLLDELTGQAGAADAAGTTPPVLGVVPVPHWQPDMKAAVLPRVPGRDGDHGRCRAGDTGRADRGSDGTAG